MPPSLFSGRSLFQGSAVALITPFDRHGSIDEKVLRSFVHFHAAAGTAALVVNGSTGEAATLSPDEQRRAVEVVADARMRCGRMLPLVAGVGGSDAAGAERLARATRDAGVDAILVGPPSFSRSQRGLIHHLRRVIDAADHAAILYNVPRRSACNLLPETIEELAEDIRVVGINEASGDISQIAEVARRVGDRIALYSGNDDQIVPILALGGRGAISVLANVAPARTARIVSAWMIGEVAEARDLQLGLLPLVAALSREPNPSMVRAAVELLGFHVGPPRLPLGPAGDEVVAELRREMSALGLGD
jgi:4-hydroxy-tetrahydrodipicolinate synthase